MARVIGELTEEGLRLPPADIARLGKPTGARIIVDVPDLPDADEIQRRALRHTLWKLGDAIEVDEPRFEAGEWVVGLWSRGGEEQIGSLVFSARGELVAGKSTTRATLG